MGGGPIQIVTGAFQAKGFYVEANSTWYWCDFMFDHYIPNKIYQPQSSRK